MLANEITLWPDEAKNDSGRTIPIPAPLRVMLVEQRARRHAECPYVCFRVDRRGHAVKIGDYRKAWQSACVRLGLGTMEPVRDRVTGAVVYAKSRPDRLHAKPKMKLKYEGRKFHDTRRSAVRHLDRSGVSEVVARQIAGHKTRSVYDRYNIVSKADLAEAARKLAVHHESEKVGDISGTTCTEVQQVASVVN